MSFLRKMFSGKVHTEDPRRYLVEAMLGAMEADGEVTDEEMEVLQKNLEGHDLFGGLLPEETARLIDMAADEMGIELLLIMCDLEGHMAHEDKEKRALVEAKNGQRALVINAMGRIFMDAMDDPFASVERELAANPLKGACDAIVVDMHAEATSEKQSMAYFLDGRASLVVGSHTHVPTADERVLPAGTAFISDIGMCGNYDSVIGMDKAEPMRRFLTKISSARFEAASGPATLTGVAVELDDANGLATKIAPVRLGGILSEAMPPFWT